MTADRPSRPSRRGFSRWELTLAVALVVGLVGFVSTRSGRFLPRDDAAALLRLVEELEDACARFHADTGEYPREYDRASYTGGSRELSVAQTLDGWAGPYLERGLTANTDNPLGAVHLYDQSKGAGNTGFDLDGDGEEETTGDLCMLYLGSVPRTVAFALDEALDGELDESAPGLWSDTGRFEWDGLSGRAYVLVLR